MSEADVCILAVDHGERRTGVAISDPLGFTAQPVELIEQPDRRLLIERVKHLVEEHHATKIVVGLPLNMDGSEGPRAEAVRGFGEALARATGLSVEYFDERLTSRQAERILAGRKRADKKKAGDVIAAQILLQCYLDRLA